MEGDRQLATGIRAGLTAAEGRSFGLTVGGAFATFAAIAWWRGRVLPAEAFGGIGALLLLSGLLLPAHLDPVYRSWMLLARIISRVTTPIVIGVLYFLVLTPIGLILKLLNRDPLRVLQGATTMWHLRTGKARQSDLRRQF